RGGAVIVTIGAGCGGTRTFAAPRGIGAGIGAGIGMPLDIAPGCCGGSTPPAGPPGMFAGAVVVGRVKLPVVSVFVAVAIGACASPGAAIVDVVLVVCPS